MSRFGSLDDKKLLRFLKNVVSKQYSPTQFINKLRSFEKTNRIDSTSTYVGDKIWKWLSSSKWLLKHKRNYERKHIKRNHWQFN